ncbi:MAG: branched-chain amino acid ABC transporter permease [Kofleriaceae bacterium]|nr:MAG: branched-chain amino acid ABC transporter permease [Kofleriaceae bacterium]MBZ0233205.1 branched-chain amino acid ABC transporter permease [Kofleriaceae bacterium]
MSPSSAARSLAERAAAHRSNVLVVIGKSAWPVAAGFLFAYLMQMVVAPGVGDFHGKLMLDVGIAIMAGLALNIVNGYAGQFSIGHAGFMAVGGYVCAGIVYYGSIKLWGSREIHGGFLGPGELLLFAGCVIGGLFAAVAGVLVGLPSLRLRGDYLAIVTLGFGEIVRVLLQQTDDVVLDPRKVEAASPLELADNLGGALGFFGSPRYLDPKNPFWIWLFVVIVLIVSYRLKYSSKGRQLLAVRENEVAAEAVGVPTTRVKVSAFITSAFFAGIGGGLYAHELGNSLRPADLGFQKSIDLVIIVVLGGMGSMTGVVVAATALTILPELFREFAEYRMIFYALALILMMILRPQGIFGIKELWELSIWKQVFGRRRSS